MVIGIDAREFITGRQTGIRRHVEAFVETLAAQRPSWRIILFIGPGCDRVPLGRTIAYVALPNGPAMFSDQVFLPRLLAKYKVNFFYSPYCKVPLFTGCTVVSTVHDIMELTLDEYRRERGYVRAALYALMCRLYFRQSDWITCDSKFTLGEVSRLFGRVAEKAAVVPLDLAPDKAGVGRGASDCLDSYGIKKPYVLYTGNFKTHKNVTTLLEAFRMLKNKGKYPHSLVLAGGEGQCEPLLRKQASESSQPVVITGFVRQNDLPAIYRNADLFVMPSLYEGFGYPLLEAMYYGVPVCSSRAASLPEVGGNAVLYCDALQPASMAGAMEQILSNPELAADLAAQGRGQADIFIKGKFASAFIRFVEVESGLQ